MEWRKKWDKGFETKGPGELLKQPLDAKRPEPISEPQTCSAPPAP